jgi:hypothetical protein
VAEDYSNFSMESIEKSLREIRQEMMDKALAAGLDPKLANLMIEIAIHHAGRDFMEVNGFKEPRISESDVKQP